MVAASDYQEPNVVLLGGPGAGKGTQAEKLLEDRDMQHLATGDILRDEVDKGTELGLEAKKYMDKGELVPDDLVVDMVQKRLTDQKGYLFDGFPRTIDQAKALDDVVDLDLVAYIKISESEAVRRLSSRRVCSECGKIFNTIFKPPEREGVCFECGGDLYQRDDDKPKVIRDRFETFLDETAPLIDFYRERGLLEEIDGEQEPDEVQKDIKSALHQGTG
ncbi:MAG: adenylate kinase [Candidatus Bipolaricaulota bacterium]|nr:adenylate kinase [Candidatus Bipolaricaulota bacterium]